MGVFGYRPLRRATTIRLVSFPRRDINHGDAEVQLALHEEEIAKIDK